MPEIPREVNGWGRRRGKRLTILLTVLSAILVVGCLFNTICSIFEIQLVVESRTLIGSAAAWQYIVVSVLMNLMDICSLFLIISFALSIVRSRSIFSNIQTFRLISIGTAHLLYALFGLLLPSISFPPIMNDGIVLEAVEPMLDIRAISVAVVFFVFSTIFEYGRVLQEEADNIL